MSAALTGYLRLVDLEVHAVIGILPHEREREQQLFFNVDIEVDFAKIAHIQGPLNVDYSEIAEVIKARVIAKKYGLLEELLIDSGNFLMEAYPDINAITIGVAKPQAVLDCKTVEAVLSFKR